MHMIRLLFAGAHVLRTREVLVGVEHLRDRLLAVRHGELPWEQVASWAADLLAELAYGYNNAGLLSSRTGSAGTTTFFWKPYGVLDSSADTLSGQTTRTYSYNNDELTRLVHAPRSADQLRRAKLGRISQITATAAKVGYTYDANGKTKTVTAGADTGGSYDYDRSGLLVVGTDDAGPEPADLPPDAGPTPTSAPLRWRRRRYARRP
jgi:hypothetical protein